LVPNRNIPKSYEELLKPEWKGKMMIYLAEQWFAGMLQIMGREKGINYMKALSQQDLLIRRESNAMRAQLLAAGEASLDVAQTFGEVEDLKKKGVSIFISSHILSEIQEICDRVAIINKGKLVAQDTVDNLGRKLNLKPQITVTLEKMSPVIEKAVKKVIIYKPRLWTKPLHESGARWKIAVVHRR
jgi:ABC-type sugar transport system ATPase subunit